MAQMPKRSSRRPHDALPRLPFGKAYNIVIDVEALIMGNVDIVEQVALVVVDSYGREVLGEKHMIWQPYNAEQLSQYYHIDPAIVRKSIDGYTLVTRDNYIHADAMVYEQWGTVRKRVVSICNAYGVAVYAKGMELESRVFYGDLPFMDLAWWGAKKYPGQVHDPLSECRFFSQFIPNLACKPLYIC